MTELGFPFARELGEQHAAVRVTLRWIEAELARQASCSRLDDSLQRSLRTFRQELGEHFSFEERHGFEGGFDSPEPEIQRVTSRLVREHREFERRMDEILDQLGKSTTAAGAVAALHAFFDDVRRHDAEESSLLLRIVHGAMEFHEPPVGD